MFPWQRWPTQERASLGLSFPTPKIKGQGRPLRGMLRAKPLGTLKSPRYYCCGFPHN